MRITRLYISSNPSSISIPNCATHKRIPMAETDLNELTNRFATMTVEDTDSPQAIRDYLREHGCTNPSKSLMKKVVAGGATSRCCCCPFVADSNEELKRHIKKEGHSYGQGRFAREKRALMKRVKTRLGERTDNINTGSERALNREEIAIFTSLHSLELTPGERGTLDAILYIGICLIFIKSKR